MENFNEITELKEIINFIEDKDRKPITNFTLSCDVKESGVEFKPTQTEISLTTENVQIKYKVPTKLVSAVMKISEELFNRENKAENEQNMYLLKVAFLNYINS